MIKDGNKRIKFGILPRFGCIIKERGKNGSFRSHVKSTSSDNWWKVRDKDNKVRECDQRPNYPCHSNRASSKYPSQPNIFTFTSQNDDNNNNNKLFINIPFLKDELQYFNYYLGHLFNCTVISFLPFSMQSNKRKEKT